MSRLVLAVDLGTGGPKVGLVTLEGELVWWEHTPVRTTYGPGGAATQDADHWWRLVVDSTRRGLAATASRGDQVVAVGITGQWASTVPVDASGAPVSDCVMWMDSRGAAYSRAVVGGHLQGYRGRALATWVRHSGGVPATSGDDPIGHMLHLERDRPDVARRARWYLEPVDFLAMRFTGVAAASPMSMTAAWLTDNRRPDVLEYDARLVGLAGVDPAKLPPLVRSVSVIGPVTPAVAAELGISPTAQVVTGLPDLHGAAVGSGCVLAHQTHASIGTTAWVSCPLPTKKTDVIRQLATVPGLGDGSYLLGNDQESAGRSLEWFRDNVAVGIGGARPTYEQITAAAATAPPGSGGVIFTPWLGGERSPVDDRRARGGFHNVSLATTQAHLARAVLEGVGHNLRWLLEAADHFTRRRLGPIRIVGGGAQSDLWCQIVADICDREVERVAEPLLAGLRGAALAAGLGLGELRPGQIRGLVPVDGTFLPAPADRETYDRAFAEFPRLYRSQRPMFRRLNDPARRP
jgi:xylulokinase